MPGRCIVRRHFTQGDADVRGRELHDGPCAQCMAAALPGASLLRAMLTCVEESSMMDLDVNGDGHGQLGRRSPHNGRLDDGRAQGWTVLEGAARPSQRKHARKRLSR